MSARVHPRLPLLAVSAGLLLAPAIAPAQAANFQWVTASSPPANAIKAPGGPQLVVCRGTQRGRLWVGSWTGSACQGSYGFLPQLATDNIQFLTTTWGTAQWVSGTGSRPTPGNIGTLPPNTIDAGSTYTGMPQVICSMGGYVGWVTQNICMLSAYGLTMQDPATVLTGQALPVYTWTTAAAPPANAVAAPDAPNRPTCRANDQNGFLWAGYWDGAECVGALSGNQYNATNHLQFLTVVSGSPQWLTGSGKVTPGDVGTLPANTINAGNNYVGYAQILCSEAGYVGWVYENDCEISAPARLGTQNTTVLIGAVQ